jgi:hypothetical protein
VTDAFHGFSQSLQVSATIISYIRLRLLSSVAFTHYSVIIYNLTLYTKSEGLTASLNKP